MAGKNANLLLAMLTIVVVGCALVPRPSFQTVIADDPTRSEQRLAELHLPRLLRPSERVYSGAEPDTSLAFETLANLGVKTIVSVDGVRPNLAQAARYDLEYVHIPIGYDGVSKPAQASLVRLMREREGPFYIHCQHGRHRGPAAAAIACRAEDTFSQSEAIAFLELAGTDRSYAGLYRDVTNFVAPTSTVELPKLVSSAEVASLASRMANLDRIFQRIVDSSAEGVHREDAVLLRQAFRESARCLMKSEASPGIIQLMREAEEASKALCEAADIESREIVARLKLQCTLCHRQFRD